jgi:superkiller protein 3
LETELGDVLDRFYWSPPKRSLDQLKAIAETQPTWPDVQFQLGISYLRAMQLPEAIERLACACRHKPDFLPARLALAAAYDEDGVPEKALEHLKIANLNQPGEAAILFALGYCSEKCRQPDLAAEYYRDVIAADGDFAAARERLAALAILLGNDAEAIDQYEHLREMWPDQSWVRTALAHLYYRQGKYVESVMHFEMAIAMEPENWSLLDDEVESLVAGGNVREAIERLHMLIREQPGFPDLHVRLGDLYSKSGDDAGAMDQYRQALDLQPTYLEALVKTGTQNLISGRWEEAAEAFHGACDLNDHALMNYVGLGVAQHAAGRKDDAMNSFELAATIEPNSGMLLGEMARLQLKAAVADEFLKSFESGQQTPVAEIDLDNDDLLHKQIDRHKEEVQRHPGHADVRYRYGVLLRSQGRLGEALEQFEWAVSINSTYIQAIVKLGITQQDLGHVDEAIETFKRILELEPEYIDVHYRLGMLYTGRRQFEQAIQHMEAASEGQGDNERFRAGLALALQNMGLMDRAAATWRSLWRIHNAQTSQQ